MRNVHKALAEIDYVKRQMARAAVFQGFAPVALLVTAALAGLAGALQAVAVPAPHDTPGAYVMLWTGVAVLAVGLIAAAAVPRARARHGGLASGMMHGTLEHFLPVAVVAALVTAVLTRATPELVWMLPGLWQVFLSLGVFAATASLPQAMRAVGLWYLLTGLTCLSWPATAVSPLAMAGPFMVGQILGAAILFRDDRGPR